jgi:hypothetical protein
VNDLLAPLLSIVLCAALFAVFGLMRRRGARRTRGCSTCASDCHLKEPPHARA